MYFYRATRGRRKSKASLIASASEDDVSDHISRQPRNLRRSGRLASPVARSGSPTERASCLPNASLSFTATKVLPKKRLVNPIEKLRKSSAAERKHAPLRMSILNYKLSSSDEEDETGAVAGPSRSPVMKLQRSSGSSKFSDEYEISVVDKEDRKRLLGEEHNELVDRILDHDRTDKGKGKVDYGSNHIVFWSSTAEGMDIDSEVDIPPLDAVEEDGLLSLLAERIQQKGMSARTVPFFFDK